MPLSLPRFPPVDERLHGVTVHDPYRWLEDRELPETEQWLEEQRARCEAYFSACDTFEELRRRVRNFLHREVLDQAVRVGGRCFYRRRKLDEEQACIYVREARTNQERLLVDPSGEGKFASAGIHRIAEDASLLAYELKHGGGDSKEIRIVDVGSGHVLPDRIPTGYARGFAFADRNRGFYFCQESSSETRDQLIQFHSFSEPTSDRVVLRRERSRESRLTLIADTVHLGAKWIHERGHELICDLLIAPRERDDDWRSVFVNKKPPYSPVLYRGRIFVFCREGAPNGKIVELGLDGTELQTVVPECPVPPRQIAVASGRFFLTYFSNGRASIRSWTLEGQDAGEIHIPAEGSCSLLPGFGSQGSSIFYMHESFSQQPSIFEYAPESGKSIPWSHGMDSQGLGTCKASSRSFHAKDRTEVPVTLVSRTGPVLRNPQPVIMTSYGGFGIPVAPQFSVLVTVMIELGAVLALPHIRGGGDLGKAWHDAGRTRNRQTAIDDYISAAEWLCAESFTAPSRLAIFGGSNSGMLAGALMTQRPDLFRAVLCIAPLLDMVRFECLNHAARWRAEYGTVENPDDFYALYAYSPYHQIRENVNYPSTLFVTGDKDDRCNPAHVRKMAARLQDGAKQHSPILVDYSAERGHSPVLPLSVRVDALTRRLAFLCRELAIEVPLEVTDEAAPS
jgi:prolyl oligopeptidase